MTTTPRPPPKMIALPATDERVKTLAATIKREALSKAAASKENAVRVDLPALAAAAEAIRAHQALLAASWDDLLAAGFRHPLSEAPLGSMVVEYFLEALGHVLHDDFHSVEDPGGS
jgi:hypothetical protein